MHPAPPQAASVLLYDDGRGCFGPLTDRRPVFDLRTGARTTRQRDACVLGMPITSVHVPAHLADVMREREPGLAVNQPLGGDTPWLVLNGRALLTPGAREALAAVTLNHVLRAPDETVIAACLMPRDAQAFVESGFEALPAGVVTTGGHAPPLISRPWHILDHLEAMMGELQEITGRGVAGSDLPGVTILGEAADHRRVFLGEGAAVSPGTVLDVRNGFIGISAGAAVGANSVLEGPCYVGRDCLVAPLTYLRPLTVIGPNCRVAGEISASIIHANTNKAHYGYLGNALVGEWVNLGAGTTVSNLKNTWGEIRMQLTADAPAEPTGRRHLGPVIGDFVRTAIGTRIPTGSCLGTASMFAGSGFCPKFMPRCRFMTDAADEPVRVDRLLATLREMMHRRQLQLSPAEESLICGLAQARGDQPKK